MYGAGSMVVAIVLISVAGKITEREASNFVKNGAADKDKSVLLNGRLKTAGKQGLCLTVKMAN